MSDFIAPIGHLILLAILAWLFDDNPVTSGIRRAQRILYRVELWAAQIEEDNEDF